MPPKSQVINPVRGDWGWRSTKKIENKFQLSLQRTGGEMVELKVGGENPVVFTVHMKLLCERIPFFEKMFTSGWKETKEKVATFPEDQPDAFDILMGWVYTGTLRSLKYTPSWTYSWDIFAFYALAGKLCLPNLQDEALDILKSLQKHEDRILGSCYLRKIYKATQPGCGLRKFAASTVAWVCLTQSDNPTPTGWTTDTLHSILQETPDLMRDYLMVLRSELGKIPVDPRNGRGCKFHEHSANEPCYQMQFEF